MNVTNDRLGFVKQVFAKATLQNKDDHEICTITVL